MLCGLHSKIQATPAVYVEQTFMTRRRTARRSGERGQCAVCAISGHTMPVGSRGTDVLNVTNK